jgi:Ca-activated chloride channel family protein
VRWLLLTLSLLLVACGSGDDAPGRPAPAPSGGTFRILAGSEIRDLEALVPAMAKAAGAPIEFTFTGSLDAVERLEAGETYDAVWLSHGKYLQQTPSLKPRIRAFERIMTSPVVFGLKASKVSSLGWDKADPTWADIVRAADSGKIAYGMTNPATSNTGFTALVGVAAALADKQDALSAGDVKAGELRKLFAGQKLTSGSSAWLSDAFVKEQDRFDGMVNYESVILSLAAEGRLKERLVPVYPRDGIVTADYPLMLLNEARRSHYEGLVGYLRSVDAQTYITRHTLRRPVSTQVEPAAAIPRRTLSELPFPASREVLDQLIEAYQSELRRPASTYFVIDTSGSMEGDGIAQLRAALAALAGADTTTSGRFARFQPRERIYLLPFTQSPGRPKRYELPADRNDSAATLAEIGGFAERLRAGGGTAIFASVKVALEAANEDRRAAPDRAYSVVVMTDGRNESGIGKDEFTRWYKSLPERDRGVRVFGLLFGKAERDQLEVISDLTGGRVFDAHKGLALAFKEIRGYQ